MNDNKISEKIYSYLENQIQDSEILKIESQICDLDDKIELLIPPDYYNEYMQTIMKIEDLRNKRNFLEFIKIYKEAFKDGLNLGIGLEI